MRGRPLRFSSETSHVMRLRHGRDKVLQRHVFVQQDQMDDSIVDDV